MPHTRHFSSLKKQEARTGQLLVLPSVLVIIVFVLYPILSNIVFSFYDVRGGETQFVGSGNYQDVLSNTNFYRAAIATLIYTASTTILTTLLGIATALLMNCRFPFCGVMRALVLFPYVAPVAAVVYAWRFSFDPVNGIFMHAFFETIPLFSSRINILEDPDISLWAIVCFSVWKNFPFTYLMILARLQAIDYHLYEAAAIDGASTWQRFRSITLPELVFVIGATILLRVIWNFNKFEEVFFLSDSTRTLPVFLYFEAFSGSINIGKGSAIAVIQFILVLTFILLYVKKVLKW